MAKGISDEKPQKDARVFEKRSGSIFCLLLEGDDRSRDSAPAAATSRIGHAPVSAAEGEEGGEMKCAHCGQERGESLSAHLASLGHDPLEHCEMLAIYCGVPTARCSGQGVARQCHLCPVGQSVGTWTQGRTGPVFEPKEDTR